MLRPLIRELLLSGNIKHVLTPCKETTALRLLRDGVLRVFLPPHNQSDIARTYALQWACQQQYFRLMTADPERVLEYTYCRNCPPVGFSVSPMTRRCGNSGVCPWCFVLRRLLPVYAALMQVPKAIRLQQDVLVWRRVLPYTPNDLPFFRSDYGPHRWCQALVTAQLVIPFINYTTSHLLLHHIGIQIVPSESDCEKQLVRRSVKPGLHVQRFKGAPGSNIIRAIALNLQLPWLELLDARNLLQFQTLLDGFKKSRLMRITYYKSKGVEDAN